MALKLPTCLLLPNSSSKKVTCSSANGSIISNQTLRVAYQGSTGAYSEFAAKTACPGCIPLPCRSFADSLAAVSSGHAHRAILPVESTLDSDASSLRHVYALLLRHDDLFISQELSLFVRYCLLAIPGVERAHLRHVISHPMALAHCAPSLSRLRLLPVHDTAGALHLLRDNNLLHTAAIASPRAASIYGLHVIAHAIEDDTWNVTRFILLSKSHEPVPPLRPVKTSMVVAHRGGSMMVVLKVLSAFSSRNVNLTKLEVNNPAMEGERGPVMILDVRGRGSSSSSTLRSFPHVLYVDFEGTVDDDNVKDAIDEIAKFSVFVRILGCYAADPHVYDLQ